MSKKYGFGVKLAVAALAVAGVVGTAGAQVGTVNAGGTAQGIALMKAGITVANVAKIDVDAKNPSGEELMFKASGAGSIDDAPTVTTLAKSFGNLGIVKVTTNSNKWDVGMTSRSGGKLLDPKSVECHDEPDRDGWGNDLGTTHQVCDPAGATYLKYWNPTGGSGGTGGAEDVVLEVAIGVAKSGKALGNTGAPTTLYPIIANAVAGGTPTFAAPIKITGTVPVNDPAGANNGTSFAKTIGIGYLSGGSAITAGPYKDGIYNTSTGTSNPDTWTQIKDNGFPAPKGNSEPQNEYFYVNVGMTETVYNTLNSNKNGTYEEVYYFELYANF